MNTIQASIQRYRTFYASPHGGLMVCPRIARELYRVDLLAPLNALDWDDPESFRTAAWQHLARFRQARTAAPVIAGDAIPCLLNLLGTGAIAAAFVRDAVVHQAADTNYLDAPLPSWSAGLDRIGFDAANPYYRAHMAALAVYVAEWDGTHALLPFPYFDPLDLCNQLRGDDLFYDFTDHPAELHALLQRVTTAILEMEVYTRSHYLKGYEFPGFGMDCWCPGTYLSCDIGDLIAPEVLMEFGRRYTQQIVAAWGGAFLHHHELGVRQIPTWAGCRGLTVQYITRDPNQRHLAQGNITADIVAASFEVPVFFEATYAEFMAGAADWRHGKFIVGVRCETPDQAREALALADRLHGTQPLEPTPCAH